MNILSSLMVILLSIVYVFSYNHQRLENDHMCQITSGILCVTDELKIIATFADGILNKVDEIEAKIRQVKAYDRLNVNVNMEMNHTSSVAPLSYYHKEFSNRNNIDKNFLTELIFEAHDAMLYYYNSISHLLAEENIFARETDVVFKIIQANLRKGIICRYRNLLYVYSQNWNSVNHIGRIPFSSARICPSCAHNVHSIVIARYLREWMTKISKVIQKIESKAV